jgi:ABC-type multidrug transport system fused ATPase/permease subunit
LDNVSFQIQTGEKVAIVGASGVGKTTITGILLKFFEPQSGGVYIDNIDIRDIKYSDIRKKIGIVQQDILLFDDSVRYNLLLGNTNLSDDEILKVCEKVGLADVIKELPFGLDTRISVNSHNLSGGQLQRLMIARILLRDISVFIFDESTSALDVETERKILAELNIYHENAISIIISHRLDTIKKCDKIIVLEDGKVVKIGTHHNLMEESQTYKNMFDPGIAS